MTMESGRPVRPLLADLGLVSKTWDNINLPQDKGHELLRSGDFGRIRVKNPSRRSRNVVGTILDRRSCPVPLGQKEDIHANLVPNTSGTTVATFDSSVYTASFSRDSSLYYTCAQDFRLHIFNMRCSTERIYQRDGLVSRMPLRKFIQGHQGNWTITDADLSPNNDRIIYSSITPTVYMTSTAPDEDPVQVPINFVDTRRTRLFPYEDFTGIWSCRFSADGNEVIAGGSGKIYVYDLLADQCTVKISAHNDDVNSCCWADTGSCNVLISASDDTFLKVWDRRSLGVSKKPSGVLIGHTEGITYASAKGDGRYIISNGKDQALRLWDLRKMRSNAEREAVATHHYGIPGFDYRHALHRNPRYNAHPKDCSVMTYRGHSVLRTLIRCHFSPVETTGGQYIYSGSADGRIHIWSLDGKIIHILNRSNTLPYTYHPSGPEPLGLPGSRYSYCVRDVSWHSQEPVIMSAAWHRGTIIARHEYKGWTKTRFALEDWVEKHRQENDVQTSEDPEDESTDEDLF